ncbi:MAG: TIGR00295 family protein [Candidatus Altiarchaeales archaeon]|nr:TIGR00295 family protein [Candidatus Altiarchaeota archaeon]MBU4267107.1 TIGR00295 family protein [Candidatus Altiarchaeota archaeon]MBU4341908.1 TIGR00295 family protein [Candidatus Altiarchaeota archaeon]MCG2782954.1 TIGR00295 family protein [Candidatus Altiarchaeales archaeon]
MQKSTEFSRRRKNKALLFLKELCAEDIVNHSLAVSKKAREIADRIKANGHDIDPDFVEIGAILHDIGRSKSHGIDHGIKGSEILRNSEFSEFARICEVHLGAGIDKEEAASLGLPARDYLLETLEEKVIAHADNLTADKEYVPISETIKKMEKKLGKGHPAIRWIKELNDFINSLS